MILYMAVPRKYRNNAEALADKCRRRIEDYFAYRVGPGRLRALNREIEQYFNQRAEAQQGDSNGKSSESRSSSN